MCCQKLIILSILLIFGCNNVISLTNTQNRHEKRRNNNIFLRHNSRSSVILHSAEPEEQSRSRPRPLPKLDRVRVGNDGDSKAILVLGGSGRIGRLVVKQLMELNLPVKAMVRDSTKKKQLEEFLSSFSLLDTDNSESEKKISFAKRKGSQSIQPLEIVVGDMAPEDARIDEDFGYEALETAIRGSDVIICCTGASRSTNFIKDFFPPWRIFQKDISNWCHDLRHPYFVNYKGTMKIIEFVQDEVERREKEKEELLEKQKQISSFHREDIEDIEKEKIAPVTIIKISDLMVVSPPWGLVVVLTNLFRSMVFRYQEMAEKALHQASSTGKINTVILRPGDLLDEERDHDEVSLQISPNGVLPGPGLVGRSDVASLAIAAALSFDKKSRHNKKSSKNMGVKGEHLSLPPKTTLAVRWVGENIYPQAQGRAIDGYKDAETCINKLLSKNNKRYEASSSSMLYNNKGNHGTKPYGLFVCMLLSTFMIMLTTLVHPFLLSFFTPSTKNILIQRLSFLIKPIVNIAGSIWNRAPSSVIY